jgi:signal transduction histidine kinase
MTTRRGLLAGRDVGLGLIALGVGLVQGDPGRRGISAAVTVIVVLLSVAVALFRRAPAAALALVWLAGVVQVRSVTSLLTVQFGIALVGYGVARHGQRPTVWLGGLAVPLGAGLSEYYVFHHPTVLPSAIDVAGPLLQHTGVGVSTVFVMGTAVLGAPWTLGLLMRFNARYRRSAADRELARARAQAAEQTAALQTQQAQMARDVHDLVGHSLAVIIAQADAAQVAAGSTTADANRTVGAALGNIAAVARNSLREVRDVLARTQGPAGPAPVRELNLPGLLDELRHAGTEVHSRVHGDPVPLDESRQTALYRVAQEMLTNALKHGEPGGRITLEQLWERTAVTVRVNNAENGSDSPGLNGMGLTGMRDRLREVQGTLELHRATNAAGIPMFTATARIPLAPEGSLS